MKKIIVDDTTSLIYKRVDGSPMPCITITTERGKLNARDIYESMEHNRCISHEPYIQIHAIYDEAPVDLYNDGDRVELYSMSDWYNDIDAPRNVPRKIVRKENNVIECPTCCSTLNGTENYCPVCGQKLED